MLQPSRRCGRCAIGVVLAAGAALGVGAAAPGQTEARWLNAVSGSWFDPALWDLGLAPNNTESETFGAVIGATGAAYQVSLDAGLRLASLRIDSSDATLSVERGGSIETGLIEVASGRLALRGGAITGALIDIGAGGALDVELNAGSGSTTTGNMLDGATVRGGAVRVADHAQLRIRGDLTLESAAIVLNHSSDLIFDGAATVRGGPLISQSDDWQMILLDGADVRFDADTAILGPGGSARLASTARLVNAGVISGRLRVSGLLGFNDGLFRNEGQFLAQGPVFSDINTRFENAGTVILSGGGSVHLLRWTNSGLIEVGDGGTLSLRGDWGNTGVIRQTGGTLRLDTSLTTAQLRDIERTGGALVLSSGMLDNTGETLVLDESLGRMVIGQITVRGGVIDKTTTASIDFGITSFLDPFVGPNLVDLTWRGGLPLGTSRLVTATGVRFEQGDITMAPRSRLILGAGVSFDGSSIVNTGGQVVLFGVSTLSGATIRLQSADTVASISSHSTGGPTTIGADTVVLVEDGIISATSGTGAMTNLGRIEALPGGHLTIEGGSSFLGGIALINAGQILIDAGATATLSGQQWRNDGSIIADGLLQITGPVTTQRLTGVQQRGDGVVEIRWIWDNAGQAFTFDDSTGSYSFGRSNVFVEGVKLTGGELAFTNGNRLIGAGGVLNGVTIRAGGDFVMDRANEAFGLVAGGLTLPDGDLVLAGSGSRLWLLAGQHRLDGFAIEARAALGDSERTIELLDGAGLVIGQKSLHGGGLVVRMQGGDLVRNEGLVDSTIAGRTIGFEGGAGDLENMTLMRAADGASLSITTGSFFNAPSARIEGGVGSGLLLAAGQWTNAGVIEFGDGAAVTLGGPSWLNFGAIRVGADATLTLNGGVNGGVIAMGGAGRLNLLGSFSTSFLKSIDRAGSDVTVSGTWNNGGANFSLAGPGIWRFEEMTINGGALDLAGRRVTVDAGLLRNVVLSDGEIDLTRTLGSLILDSGAALDGVGVRLSGSGAALRMTQTNTSIDFDVELRTAPGGAQGRIELSPGLGAAIGAEASIRGGRAIITGSGAALVNEGLISSDRAGESLQIILSTGSFDNQGVVEATNGALLRLVGTAWRNVTGGALSGGAYRVIGDGSAIDFGRVTITSNAADIEMSGATARFDAIASLGENLGRFALSAGHAFATIGAFANDGTLEIDGASSLLAAGAFEQGAGATLALTLGAPDARERGAAVAAAAEAILDGRLALALGAGGALGDRWRLVESGGRVGVFAEVESVGLGAGRWFVLEYDATGVSAVLVPAPSTAALCALGLFGAAGRRRRAPALRSLTRSS